MECTIIKTDDELLKEEPHVKAESLLEEILPFFRNILSEKYPLTGKLFSTVCRTDSNSKSRHKPSENNKYK